MISSIVLFYCGIAFAYYVILPIVFAFITSTVPHGVSVMTDISKYLDFVLTMFFAFGAAFEIPVATVILVLIGVTTPDALVAKRSYVILVAFIVAAFFPPNDVVSQTLIALPMWFLFEAGVFFSRFVLRQRSAAAQSTELDHYDNQV